MGMPCEIRYLDVRCLHFYNWQVLYIFLKRKMFMAK